MFANANLDSTFHFSFLSNGQTDRQQLRFNNIDTRIIRNSLVFNKVLNMRSSSTPTQCNFPAKHVFSLIGLIPE